MSRRFGFCRLSQRGISCRVRAVLAGSLIMLLSACSCAPKLRSPLTRPIPKRGTTAVGTASWYGPGFHGKRTACGEKYDQDGLTAAHGSWPCNTKVRVTFLSNNKTVIVRINDLFPNHKRRLIDLSKGAAKEIGLIGPGTGRVRLEVLP